MRILEQEEIEQVSGGVINLVTGIAGAGIGALFGGLGYLAQAAVAGTDVTLGGFIWETGTMAASGFLIGTGTGLVYAAVTGAAPGAAVLGVTLIGTGGAVKVSTAVAKVEDGGS